MPDVIENTIDLVELTEFLKKHSLLVVDDDRESLELFSSIMKKFFKYVGVAQDGAIAIDKINNYPYDALITDNFMPDISGRELITKIRNGEAAINDKYRSRIENMPIYLLTRSLKKDVTNVLNLKDVYYSYRDEISTSEIIKILCTLQKHIKINNELYNKPKETNENPRAAF